MRLGRRSACLLFASALFTTDAAAIRPAPPEPERVAIVPFGPVAELTEIALRSGANIAASVVDATDVQTAGSRAQTRWVVAADGIWDLRADTVLPLPPGDSAAARALAIADAVAGLQGAQVGAAFRSGFASRTSGDAAALAA